MEPTKPPPPALAEAHRLITTTARPVADIAAGLGLSVDALDKRLARAYGKRSRQLRAGGEAKRGRSPSGRKAWQIRLTVAEREQVEDMIAAGRAAGASTDGAALVRALSRVPPAEWALAEARIATNRTLPGDWDIINARGQYDSNGLGDDRRILGERADYREFLRARAWLAATPQPPPAPPPAPTAAPTRPSAPPFVYEDFDEDEEEFTST